MMSRAKTLAFAMVLFSGQQALTLSVDAISGAPAATTAAGELYAQTQGMDNRQDRRDDRSDERNDRQDDRQDCRTDEGVVSDDKRDCKQDSRQDDVSTDG